MINKINEEIHRFWNEKGIEPNALMLGIGVINELLSTHQLIVKSRTEKIYICGCEIIYIDNHKPEMIKAALL